MTHTKKATGPWTHRFLVGVFAVMLAMLSYWLLDFVVRDIGRWPGPSFDTFEQNRLDRQLVGRAKAADTQIADARAETEQVDARQKLLSDSTSNSQRTMNQLLEMQRLKLEQGVTLLPEEQEALAESEKLFLANQKQYQQLNEQAVELDKRLRSLQASRDDIEKALEENRTPLREEFAAVYQQHELKVAAMKLAVLIPLLAVVLVLFVRYRASAYAPLLYAFGIALVLKVGLVMHEHFPTKYFKYILILVCLAVVVRVLVHLIRMVYFPKGDWLLRQYREAYEVFLCPICGFPIRRGPLKYLFWNRRTIRKLTLPRDAVTVADETYTCPTCSTPLYEQCASCGAVRHSLLPTCHKCGNTQPVPGVASA